MSEHFWVEKKLSPLRIILDPLNPRIEVPDGANQTIIRKNLIEYGKVINLANSIIEFGGLLHGERIIVCKEGNQYTVLEGNRRVCACQLILDTNLLPKALRRSLKRVTSELKTNIAKIRAEVAPTRDDAEPVITKRHTDVGVLAWNTSAKMRRASRLLEEGYSIDDIAEKLSAPRSTIKQAIREYRLFRYVINLGGWSEQEQETLMNQSIKTNPFTRFFNLGGAKEKLGLFFDEHDHPKTKHSQDLFDKQMRHIARSFLIPDPTNDNKPIANTRTSVDAIFSRFNPEENSAAEEPSTSEKQGGKAPDKTPPQKERKRAKPKAATASEFFENLTCSVQDDRLIGIADEIRRIDYKHMPIAASMLLRGLIESALDFQIRSVKKYGELHKSLFAKTGKSRDVGLSDLIKFCGDKRNNIFISPRTADALRQSAVSVYKDQLDIIIHGKWAAADSDILIKAATALRPIINYILEGQPQDSEE